MTPVIENLQITHPGPFRFIPDDRSSAIEVRMIDRIFDNDAMAQMQRVVNDGLRAAPSASAPSCRSRTARRLGLYRRYAYLGCGTIRMYGRGAFQPSGYVLRASSSDTDPAMITSSPCLQFTGVATLCWAVN
jgi:hypothetical protein